MARRLGYRSERTRKGVSEERTGQRASGPHHGPRIKRPEAPAQSAPPVEGGRMEPWKVRSIAYARTRTFIDGAPSG